MSRKANASPSQGNPVPPGSPDGVAATKPQFVPFTRPAGALGDVDELSLGDSETELLGDELGDGLEDGDSLGDSETLLEAEPEGDSETDELGDGLLETDELGDSETLDDGDSEIDELIELEGLSDALLLGEPLGLSEAEDDGDEPPEDSKSIPSSFSCCSLSSFSCNK